MKSELLTYVGAWVLIPSTVFVMQVILNRSFKGKKPQLLAMAAIMTGYLPFFALLILLPVLDKPISFYAYMFLLYSFTAYTYFHVFNMSETSRRVRMLTSIATHGAREIHQLEAIYDGMEMIRTRIDRLVGLGQLRVQDGILYPKGSFFSILGRVIYALSCLVGRPWGAIEKFEKQPKALLE